MQSRTVKVCVCGHQEETHEHYRFGSDCSICGRSGCDRYLHGPAGWVRHRIHPHGEPKPDETERPVLRLVP